MKPESKLLKAARVFNFRTDDKQDDDIIGNIRGVLIYAGEMRRLNIAIHEEDDRRYFDSADDGPEVNLIRAFRMYPEGAPNWVRKGVFCSSSV